MRTLRRLTGPSSRIALMVALALAIVVIPGWSGFTIRHSEMPGAVAQTSGGTPSPRVPLDVQVPIFGECLATPRDFEDAMALLRAQLYDPSVVIPPSWATGVRDSPTGPVQSYELPDGPAPTPEQIAEVTDLFGQYLNCPTSAQSIGYWTDDNLIRSGLSGEDSGFLISGLWEEAKPPEPEPEPSYPEPITDGNGSVIEAPLPPREYEPTDLTGSAAQMQLYGFRWVDQTHIGAYVDNPGSVSSETTTIDAAFDWIGFVVFEQQPDGSWLVDELVNPYEIVEQRLSSAAEATPVA